MTGRIIQVIRSRACGFIRAESGQNVFFHASDLHRVKLADLDDRLAVRFDLIPDSVSGPRAARVQLDRRARRQAPGPA
jgi:cold shock CspA family protein